MVEIDGIESKVVLRYSGNSAWSEILRIDGRFQE